MNDGHTETRSANGRVSGVKGVSLYPLTFDSLTEGKSSSRRVGKRLSSLLTYTKVVRDRKP